MGGEGRALDALAMAHMIAGDLDAAITHAREALPRLARAGERQTEASCLSNLAWALLYRGRRAEGEPSMLRALELARAIGARAQEAYVHTAAGELVEPYGEWGRAFAEGETGAGDRPRAGPPRVDGRGALGRSGACAGTAATSPGRARATRRCWRSPASSAPPSGSRTR